MRGFLLLALCLSLFGAIWAAVPKSNSQMGSDVESSEVSDPGYEISYLSNSGGQIGAVSTRNPILQIELTTGSQIQLSWTAVAGAVSYNIYHAVTPLPPLDPGWEFLANTASLTLAVEPAQDAGFYLVRGSDTLVVPLNFVWVAGGTFYNGAYNITVPGFYIDKFEVTQESYQSVMGANPAHNYGVGGDYPVYYVNWTDCIAYCQYRSMQEGLTPCYTFDTTPDGGTNYGNNIMNWPSYWNQYYDWANRILCNWSADGYRLPSEMEWMFAAKGGSSSQNYTYSGSNDVNAVAWYNLNSGGTTHSVGTKVPNELGLYDMSGNLWEWNWNYWSDLPSDAYGPYWPPFGGQGQSRDCRGGSWDGHYSGCAISYRGSGSLTARVNWIGFRVARSH